MTPRIIRNETPWQVLALGLIPLVLFVGLSAFLSAYGNEGVSINFAFDQDAAEERFYLQAELTGRYRFFAAVLFYTMICLGVTIIVALEIVASHTRKSCLQLLALWFFLAAAYLILVAPEFGMNNSSTFHLIDEPYYKTALTLGATTACGEDCPRTALTVFERLTFLSNIATAIGATAAVVAMISTISEPRLGNEDEKLDHELEAAHLSACAADSQRYIILAGAVLSSGIVSFAAWTHWPLGMLPDMEKKVLSEVAEALTLYTGVTFSVLILSYFLPSAAFHSSRAQRIAERYFSDQGTIVTNSMVSTWRKDHKLTAEPIAALKVIAATTSPILASTLGGVPGFGAF
ncbi:MAG: hypothetical protein AAGF71_03960 [Pseudomonadota bacterium]